MFIFNCVKYILAMPAISVVNSFLKVCFPPKNWGNLIFQVGLSELKLRFRERLTKHLYNQYLKWVVLFFGGFKGKI